MNKILFIICYIICGAAYCSDNCIDVDRNIDVYANAKNAYNTMMQYIDAIEQEVCVASGKSQNYSYASVRDKFNDLDKIQALLINFSRKKCENAFLIFKALSNLLCSICESVRTGKDIDKCFDKEDLCYYIDLLRIVLQKNKIEERINKLKIYIDTIITQYGTTEGKLFCGKYRENGGIFMQIVDKAMQDSYRVYYVLKCISKCNNQMVPKDIVGVAKCVLFDFILMKRYELLTHLKCECYFIDSAKEDIDNLLNEFRKLNNEMFVVDEYNAQLDICKTCKDSIASVQAVITMIRDDINKNIDENIDENVIVAQNKITKITEQFKLFFNQNGYKEMRRHPEIYLKKDQYSEICR